MAIRTGQVAGYFSDKSELIPSGRKIVKIGIQAPEGTKFLFNDLNIFEIGKSNMLQFDNVNLHSVKLISLDKEFIIIDYQYKKEE